MHLRRRAQDLRVFVSSCDSNFSRKDAKARRCCVGGAAASILKSWRKFRWMTEPPARRTLFASLREYSQTQQTQQNPRWRDGLTPGKDAGGKIGPALGRFSLRRRRAALVANDRKVAVAIRFGPGGWSRPVARARSQDRPGGLNLPASPGWKRCVRGHGLSRASARSADPMVRPGQCTAPGRMVGAYNLYGFLCQVREPIPRAGLVKRSDYACCPERGGSTSFRTRGVLSRRMLRLATASRADVNMLPSGPSPAPLR